MAETIEMLSTTLENKGRELKELELAELETSSGQKAARARMAEEAKKAEAAKKAEETEK